MNDLAGGYAELLMPLLINSSKNTKNFDDFARMIIA